MRLVMIAALAALALALAPEAALAKKHTKMTKAGAACSPGGKTCTVECGPSGWCNRMVCTNAGKWEKRITDCWGPVCPPKC